MKIFASIAASAILITLATTSNAATVNSWGKGADGPSSVRLLAVSGPNGKVGEIHFQNAINIGSGSQRGMTFDFDGYGAIDLDVDSTLNSNCPGYCPDTLSVLSLPKQLTASANFLSVAESTLGIISLYISPDPRVPTDRNTPIPAPIPATALLLIGALCGLASTRRRG